MRRLYRGLSPLVHTCFNAPQPAEVKASVHKQVAKLLSWSMRFAADGQWPLVGFQGEELDIKTLRGKMKGLSLGAGWRHHVAKIFVIFIIRFGNC